MAMYAFFLAGSNYFSPVICGFIADGQGWQWVFYWPSIFLAIAFVFLFFFMEETNYERVTVGVVETASPTSTSGTSGVLDEERKVEQRLSEASEVTPVHGYKKKSFWQKMALKDKPKPNNLMLKRALQGLSFLSWPVVFYAG